MTGKNITAKSVGLISFVILILSATIQILVPVALAQTENRSLIVAQEEVGPATTIKVQVINTDLNRDPYSAQSTFCNINVTSSTGVQKAFLDVYETGADTGIFEGRIHLNPLQTMPSQYNNNLTIKALPDDLVHISYDV
ncbi:MAG: hypothetical protein ACREAO_03030 [Nitrososphaera sp.]